MFRVRACTVTRALEKIIGLVVSDEAKFAESRPVRGTTALRKPGCVPCYEPPQVSEQERLFAPRNLGFWSTRLPLALAGTQVPGSLRSK